MVLMRKKINDAYKISLQLQKKINDRKKTKSVSKHIFSLSKSEIMDTGEIEDFVPTKFAVVSIGLFPKLSAGAIKIVLKIIEELHYQNTLWLYNHNTNSRKALYISELRKLKVLFPTEVATIHYVNPFFIRRGKLETIVPAMIKLLDEHNMVSPEIIHDLSSKGVILISPIDMMSIDEMDSF